MDLPNELYLRIFTFLGKKDVKSIRITCKHFSELANIILFSYPRMKKKLKLETSQLLHLPIICLNNRYLKRFLNADSFPTTVNTVILSQRKPVIPPETIFRYPHIQFYISFGYFYPVNVLHESNYALLENVKLYSSASSPMRYKILYKYNYFVFRYINTNHLELFIREGVTA